MISTQDRNTLKLIERSPDRGDGWRSVSKTCWPLIEAFAERDLLEIDHQGMRVRFSEAGQAVVMFAI